MYKISKVDLVNKLFCTFVDKEKLESCISEIQSYYTLLHDRIFILEVLEGTEYLCTYNIDPFNSKNTLLQGTILLHRKKDTNTLYTINGLNSLIRSLNNGKEDQNYKVDWLNYRNTVIITRENQLNLLKTRLYEIYTV